MPQYDLNHAAGTGLLSLPEGFGPLEYGEVRAKIEAEGYEIDPHEKFWAQLHGRTFYTLRRGTNGTTRTAAGARAPGRKTTAVQRESHAAADAGHLR